MYFSKDENWNASLIFIQFFKKKKKNISEFILPYLEDK